MPIELDSSDTLAIDLRPISIRVFDTFAIVHHFLRYAYADAEDAPQFESMIWTDVLLRASGRWYWIGDHGGSIDEQ